MAAVRPTAKVDPSKVGGPGGLELSWNDFFHDWVAPVVHFGTPVLVVFAVLTATSRSLTRVLVGKHSPGPRRANPWDRRGVAATYWLGVVTLFWAAVQVGVVYPRARESRLGGWVSMVSIGLTAASGVSVAVLYCVVGRAPRGNKHISAEERERLRRSTRSHARVVAAWTVAVPVIAAAIFLVTEFYFNCWVSFRWLNDRHAPLVYAPLLAGLGIVVVGRTRGIGMGLLIQGHDKTGADDGGLGAFIRARLHAMASRGPNGIEVTQQTDVQSLPSEALSLIPEGTLAKVAQWIVQLFTPATPWRIDVTEQSDGSIVVSVQRNGKVVDAAVIRAATLGLPAVRELAPAVSLPEPASPAGTPANAEPADWSVELRTAAAAFVLLTLSHRFEHLRLGLAGATNWRSVSLQIIATDPTSRLPREDRRELLAKAVGFDGGNIAAELAFVSLGRPAGVPTLAERRRGIERLKDVRGRITNEEGMAPLLLRVRFNLMAAYINYAASLPVPLGDLPSSDDDALDEDARGSRNALTSAARQARALTVYWSDTRSRKDFAELWRDMAAALEYGCEAIEVEWSRRFDDPLSPQLLQLPEGESSRHMTLLARYERACAHAVRASITERSGQRPMYDSALDDLEMAVAEPRRRLTAQSDPSLLALHDIDMVRSSYDLAAPGAAPQRGAEVGGLEIAERPFDAAAVVTRFKSLIGNASPKTFLDLPVFTAYRALLADRGIHGAADLPDTASLSRELGVTAMTAERLTAVTKLYRTLRERARVANNGNDADSSATQFTFLLLLLDIDSTQRLVTQLREHRPEGLRKAMIDKSRGWDVVTPSTDEVTAWGALR